MVTRSNKKRNRITSQPKVMDHIPIFIMCTISTCSKSLSIVNPLKHKKRWLSTHNMRWFFKPFQSMILMTKFSINKFICDLHQRFLRLTKIKGSHHLIFSKELQLTLVHQFCKQWEHKQAFHHSNALRIFSSFNFFFFLQIQSKSTYNPVTTKRRNLNPSSENWEGLP